MDEIAKSIIASNNANQASNADVISQLRGDKSGRNLTNGLVLLFCALVLLFGWRQQNQSTKQDHSITAIGKVAAQNSQLISFVAGIQTPSALAASRENTQRGREYVIECTAAAVAAALGHPIPDPVFAPPKEPGAAALPACPGRSDP